jgi:hypothetical protein
MAGLSGTVRRDRSVFGSLMTSKNVMTMPF